MAKKRILRPRFDRQTVGGCLREFLTPGVWRMMHTEVPGWDERAQSWELVTCVLTGVWWALSDGRQTFKKRFHEARRTVGQFREKRRAPGQTLSGFLQALGRLPYRSLVVLREAVRIRIISQLGDGRIGRWQVFAADGSRLKLPRSEINERTWGWKREGDAPNLWVTAIQNLGTGVLHDWCFGPVRSSERAHLRRMLNSLPEGSLLLADIGFGGFEQWVHMDARNQYFVIRVCSMTQLLIEEGVDIEQEGAQIWIWPRGKRKQRPLALRVIRHKARGESEAVWLLTNVLSPSELSDAEAGQLYKARWRIEVDVFRGLKQTLGKAKLMGRTPAIVLREAELAMLALMLCQAMASRAVKAGGLANNNASLATTKELLETYGEKIRQGRKGWDFSKKLRTAVRDAYPRLKPKAARRPVKIKDVQPPRPPKTLMINDRLKAKIRKRLEEEMTHAA